MKSENSRKRVFSIELLGHSVISIANAFGMRKYQLFLMFMNSQASPNQWVKCHSASRALDVRKTRTITTEPQLA